VDISVEKPRHTRQLLCFLRIVKLFDGGIRAAISHWVFAPEKKTRSGKAFSLQDIEKEKK
jgi:hypothetical protein